MTTDANSAARRGIMRAAGAAAIIWLFVFTSPARAAATLPIDPLGQFSTTVQGLVSRVSPAVVQVLVSGYGPLDSRPGDTDLVVGRQRSLASGVIVDSAGYIITNAHVVNGGQRIDVILPGAATDEAPMQSLVGSRGRTIEARIVGIAPEVDLALLKVNATGLTALPLADYDSVRQGEVVFAFGSPEGLRNSVTMGIVSAVARQPDADHPMVYIQTDAPINHGNSGGPLVNVKGELVGINTFIVSESNGSQGLGFAIPSAIVDVAVRQLRTYGHLHQGQIGANFQTVTTGIARGLGLPQDWGVIVSDLLPGGPAEAAGMRIGDIVTGLDGRPVDSLPLLAFHLYTKSAGESVKVTLIRGAERRDIDVPVAERPHEVGRVADALDPEKTLVRQLGVLAVGVDEIGPVAAGLRTPAGVIVAARMPDPRASDVSLAAGDVIHAINGRAVTSVPQLRSALDNMTAHSSVVLQIERDGLFTFLSFELG